MCWRILNMDELLELLDRYDCHLKRNEKSMVDFLSINFEQYLKDLRKANVSEKNQLVGKEMCQKVDDVIDDVENNMHEIINVLKLYRLGNIVDASIKLFSILDKMKPYLMFDYTGNFHKDSYFRIRKVDEKQNNFERNEMFHIPLNKNHLIGTERYSMPGYPCLYLATQIELCWYECGQPNEFYISKFGIPDEEDNSLKLIDFSEKLCELKHSFICWFNNEKDKDKVRNYLLKYLYTYPLRAACSVTVEHRDGRFKEEYIIPQLLLQWIRKDKDFYGVKYESCKPSDKVRNIGGYNLVLLTKDFDGDGYDKFLRNNVKISIPHFKDFNSVNSEDPECFIHIEKSLHELEYI